MNRIATRNLMYEVNGNEENLHEAVHCDVLSVRQSITVSVLAEESLLYFRTLVLEAGQRI